MHVKKTMKTMKSRGTYKKGDGLKKVIMEAKKSYKKHKGGADGDSSSSDDTAAAAPAPTSMAATPEVKPDAPAAPAPTTAMGGRRKRGTRRTRRLRK
jgi:hypothetical protein